MVQGYELIDGVPVVYSLGNAVFGGNRDPRDYDALLLQAVFAYEDGAPVSVRLVFHPISVSGETSYNNYQPVLLAGDDAQRVLDKMADSTGVTPPAYEEGRGAETEAFPVGGRISGPRPARRSSPRFCVVGKIRKTLVTYL